MALTPPELEALSARLDALMLGQVAEAPYDRYLMMLEGASSQTRGWKGATLDYRKIQGLEHDPVIMEYPIRGAAV